MRLAKNLLLWASGAAISATSTCHIWGSGALITCQGVAPCQKSGGYIPMCCRKFGPCFIGKKLTCQHPLCAVVLSNATGRPNLVGRSVCTHAIATKGSLYAFSLLCFIPSLLEKMRQKQSPSSWIHHLLPSALACFVEHTAPIWCIKQLFICFCDGLTRKALSRKYCECTSQAYRQEGRDPPTVVCVLYVTRSMAVFTALLSGMSVLS